MPVHNAKSFARKSKKSSSPEGMDLILLKEELLMLSSLKNNSEEQANLVELDGTVSIDDEDQVKEFIANIPSKKSHSLIDADTTLVDPASESCNGGSELIPLDLPTIGEDEDDPLYAELYAEDDAPSSAAKPSNVTPFIEPSSIPACIDLTRSVSFSLARKLSRTSFKRRSRRGSRSSFAHDDDDDDDDMSVSSSASTMSSISTLGVKLVTSKVKLVAAKAKESAAKGERALEQKIEEMRRLEEAARERRQEELAKRNALKEARIEEMEMEKEAAKERRDYLKEVMILEKEMELALKAEAKAKERQLMKLKKAELAKMKAETELEQAMSRIEEVRTMDDEYSLDSDGYSVVSKKKRSRKIFKTRSGKHPQSVQYDGSSDLYEIVDDMRDDVAEALVALPVKALKIMTELQSKLDKAVPGVTTSTSKVREEAEVGRREEIEDDGEIQSWLGWLMGNPEGCCGSSCTGSSINDE
mmetsp:Transcript_11427/g.25079  ORF Transcript_11427/g.25079 Transcript_11427/m.25079 type:complete len:472 (+) Transcript_11427:54-1469(+)